MQNISRRRYPRARPDLRFQSVGGSLGLRDGTGTRAERLEFTAALVLTYCDGRHDVSAIADAVAGSVGHADRDALHADVQRILEDFASGGLVT